MEKNPTFARDTRTRTRQSKSWTFFRLRSVRCCRAFAVSERRTVTEGKKRAKTPDNPKFVHNYRTQWRRVRFSVFRNRRTELESLTFWNSGALSFSSRTITLIGTSTKLSCSESPPDASTLSLIVTKNDNVSLSCGWRPPMCNQIPILR